ncbi:hypothetical protein [Streptomyces chiangmaiensis]|uniref:Uncharacterized protein n=1 Tax=Streptomyces chiangmaiensis TaxID=766497 RepID=A0ABU7FTV0_9ACTN|nr:hypothetical protein [Streptomyces chiangmaiensis]MED7826923.1 hypothetical protein [Streptomyces chiangmaiensis]
MTDQPLFPAPPRTEPPQRGFRYEVFDEDAAFLEGFDDIETAADTWCPYESWLVDSDARRAYEPGDWPINGNPAIGVALTNEGATS